MVARAKILSRIYRKLYQSFGPQRWWPAQSKFEVVVGAIMTQNTNWNNVEKAIDNLKDNNLLTPKALYQLSPHKLAEYIRPAGYYNIKARRLKNFLTLLFTRYNGRIEAMGRTELKTLREELLSVNGIGPETADSILLYAFNKPIFVVDAYTKRIFSRHKIIKNDLTYHQIQDRFMRDLKLDTSVFNEYHALIVQCAKDHCRTKASCGSCPLEFLNKQSRYKEFAYTAPASL